MKRPKIKNADRIFWVWLSKIWDDWKSALIIVKPETVVGWHRKGFKLYWKWKSRRVGRPTIDWELIKLIRKLQKENPIWTPVVRTICFKAIYVYIAISHDRRRILHFGVTSNPHSQWAIQQLREAFAFDDTTKYVIRDNDKIFSEDFKMQIKRFGL